MEIDVEIVQCAACLDQGQQSVEMFGVPCPVMTKIGIPQRYLIIPIELDKDISESRLESLGHFVTSMSSFALSEIMSK